MVKKRILMLFVVVLLVLPIVYAGFWSDFFGSRENLVGEAGCDGFWECFWDRENVVGGADE